MNYNEEMAELFKEVGLESGIRKLNPEEKATSEDWAWLEKRIQDEFEECDRILDNSMRLANAIVAMENYSKKS